MAFGMEACAYDHIFKNKILKISPNRDTVLPGTYQKIQTGPGDERVLQLLGGAKQ